MKETLKRLLANLASSMFRREQGLKTPLRSKSVPMLRALSSLEDGYILTAAFAALEKETAGLVHGTATLTIHIKDGKMNRYVTSRERSFAPGKPMTGGHNGK